MKKTHTRLANCSALPYPSASPAPLINNTPGLEYKKNLPQQTQSHFCSLQWDVQALWSLQRHIHEGGVWQALGTFAFRVGTAQPLHNPNGGQVAELELSWPAFIFLSHPSKHQGLREDEGQRGSLLSDSFYLRLMQTKISLFRFTPHAAVLSTESSYYRNHSLFENTGFVIPPANEWATSMLFLVWFLSPQG